MCIVYRKLENLNFLLIPHVIYNLDQKVLGLYF